jgi:DNA-binding response OmpR family regulator
MGKKIYVADDDPAILEVIELVLEDAGFEVETSTDGLSILQERSDFPDLILLDIRMSGTNGGDICRSLKEERKTRHLPVILVSANKDLEDIARNCGADAVIAKPFDIDDLLATCERAMN